MSDEGEILDQMVSSGVNNTEPGDMWTDDDDDEILSDNEIDEAQLQWEESVDELKRIATMIIMPLAGKFMGRRFAYNCMFLVI